MNQVKSNGFGRSPLLLLGAAVVVLALLIVMYFRSDFWGNSFSINDAKICIELDRSRIPSKVSETIQYGTRQICLWFKYSSAPEGTLVQISWYYNDSLVLTESLKLIASDGERAFYLLQEDGSALPVGDYRVVISSSTEELKDLKFVIIPKK